MEYSNTAVDLPSFCVFDTVLGYLVDLLFPSVEIESYCGELWRILFYEKKMSKKGHTEHLGQEFLFPGNISTK